MTKMMLPKGVEVLAEIKPGFERILTFDALHFVAQLSRAFEVKRRALLIARQERAERLDNGEKPSFLIDTVHIRVANWHIAELPNCRIISLAN